MKTIIHLTTIMFFVVFVTVCGSQTSDNSATSMSFTPWTQTNGPEGALFGGIAYDAVRDYLYATTNVGTFVRYNYKWYQIGSFASSSISVAPNGVVFAVDKKLGTAYKYIPPSAGNAPTGTLEQVGTGGIGGIVKVSPSGEVYILSNNLYHLEGTNWVLVPGSVGGSSLEFVGTNIYIGSSNGIFKYDGSLWTQVNTSMSDPTNCTVIAYNPVNSLLYFGDPYTRLGIFSYNPSTGVILGPIAGTENSKFSAITATSSGDVFAIGAKAIYMNFVELPETRRANGAQGLGAQSLITYNTRVYATVGSHILQSAPPYTVWTIPNLTLNETGKPIVGTTVTALLKNPINNFIFAGTDDGEIFFTSNPDFGWDQLRYSKAIPVERGKITSFAHFYNAERGIERIFAGREEGGVYYSGGTGWDWGSFNEDPLDKVVNTLTVYPPYENTTVCSGQKQLGKVFAGTENGLFWSHCYDECDIPDADWGVIKDEDVFQRPIFALATGPAPAYTLYALNGEAVLRSEDGGDTWSTPYGDGPESPTSIAINSFGHLFVISNYTELWRSLDEGTTWTLIGEIGENSDMASGIISMTFNAKGQLFVADENKQVFGSNDNGTTWHKMVNGLDVKDLLVLSKGNDSSLLAGVYYGVWKTDEPVPKPTGCFDILAQPAECVAWWSGDNNMLDLGYNEHDLTGGVAYNPTGKFGQSFHFDGMGQYLYINDPVDGDLDFVSSNNALTISVWIKQPSVSNYKCIVAKENYNGSGNHVGYRFSTNGGTLLFEIGDGTTSSGVLFSSNNSPMIVDTWYQVAVVFSGVNKPTFYINGSAYPAFQNSTPPSGSVDTDQPLYIGNSLYAFGSFFNGDIDEIVIFNRQLSTVELGQLASNGNGICKPSTLSARTLNLIQPNLPDITWFIGTTRTIQWSSSCVGKINLEYSADNGSTWQPIANEIDASLGEYPWTIPSVTTSLARLKISSSTQPAVVYDISDFTFTIRDQWALIAELNQPTVQWTDASFVTKDIGWIVGTKGNMSKTVDGGKTWTSLIHPQSRNFTGISSINTSSVVAIGNNDNSNNETFHIRTSNGGQSWWINQNAFAPYKMYDISYSNFATGWWVGRKTDENKGIIFKVDVNSNISSVKLFTSPTQFTGTHFLKNSTQGWATGDNGKIFKTTDGNNWQELITNVSSTINDISFADTQNGWAVGDNGLILSTNDGGTTWTEIMPHPTSQNLYGISMLNKNLGWTVGGSGTVFKYIGPGLAQKAKSRFSSNFSGGWLPYQTEATKDLFTAAFAGGTVGIILGDSGETIGYQPTFEDSFYVSVSNTLNRGWNIVSIPVQPDDFTTTILFPSALSNAFKFTSSFGYQSSDTMQNKISYWLKDTTENTFNFTGSLILKDTFELGEGWNMIGSISNPIDIATITTDPPGILESNFFKYHQGYLVADSIEPGKGYWIKTNRAGRMMLETPPGGSSTIFSKFTVNGFDRLNRLNIHDNAGYNQALFFGTSPGEKFGASKYEMPPNPPLGIFDARFASQRLVEVYKEGTEDVYSYQILVSSATSPLKISLSTVSNFKGEVSVNGKKLKNGQELVLHVSDETTLRMDVKTTRSVPQAFTLHQNYPNPFNPSSTVAFDLPAALEVSLKIYDLLGREVMTVLDNQQYEAGNHEITFNASSFASGVYFYRMQARGETVNYFDVKKMLLVK